MKIVVFVFWCIAHLNCVLFWIITLTITTKGFMSIVSSTQHHECFFFSLKKGRRIFFFHFHWGEKKILERTILYAFYQWVFFFFFFVCVKKDRRWYWPNRITTELNLYLFIKKRESNTKRIWLISSTFSIGGILLFQIHNSKW